MFKFLFGIIAIFGLFLLLTGAVGVKILRSLFGFGNKPQQPKHDEPRNYPSPENRDKIFGEHEGEYVEFEEIKENPEKKDSSDETDTSQN